MRKQQWVVVDKRGNLYAASNADTKKMAVERHEHDLGEFWSTRKSKGDKAIKVIITTELKETW